MIYEDKVLTKEHIKVEEGDYLCADDHLLYCGRCHTPKQVRIQLNGQPKIMNCLCRCGTEKRDAEEEAWKRRDRMNRIKRLRVEGLQIPLGRTYTFAHDDGSNPKMEFARSYVKSWNNCREKNLGLFLTGGVGSGKTFFAGCIANALIDEGVPVMMVSIPRMLQTMMALQQWDLAQYICEIDQYSLLILDDYDPENLTPAQRRLLFTIIDRRYGRKQPMIIISARSMEVLKAISKVDVLSEGNLGRILEVCQPIAFLDKDFRSKRIQSRRELARTIIGDTRRECHAG